MTTSRATLRDRTRIADLPHDESWITLQHAWSCVIHLSYSGLESSGDRSNDVAILREEEEPFFRDLPTADPYREFASVPRHQLGLHPQLLFQCVRRPGGSRFVRRSNETVANDDLLAGCRVFHG